MYYILTFLLFCTSQAFSFDVHTLPVHRIEAEKVRTEDKKIILEGSVVAVLDLGTVTCGKAVVLMDESSKHEKKEDFSRLIEMEQHVIVNFTDGSLLSADRGTIDCMKREGIFWGSDTEKVIYETSLAEEEVDKSRMRASSNCLRGVLVKTESGWKLEDLNAEGAVCIEYRPEKGKKK